MPYCKCPVCDTVFHLRVRDAIAWYRERWPNYRFGSEVPEVCFHCWGDLDLDQRVKLRWLSEATRNRSSLARPGDIGVVVDILPGDDGEKAYRVRCVNDDGELKWEEVLARRELYRLAKGSNRTPSVIE